MKQLTELRTQEEQEKYDIAIAWLEKFAKKVRKHRLKFDKLLKDIDIEFEKQYPGELVATDTRSKAENANK